MIIFHDQGSALGFICTVRLARDGRAVKPPFMGQARMSKSVPQGKLA